MSTIISSLVPTHNIEIYGLIYVIEVVIRELIIERLSARHGPRWYLEAIPGGGGGQKDGQVMLSMLDKYKRGEKSARAAPWTANIPHHPIYYLDFPELATVIERKNNWDAFQDIFFRKDIAISTLRELEPIRNKVAHNRKATKADLTVVRGAFEKLSAAVGAGRMAELAARCTNAEELPALLAALDREAERARERLASYEPLEGLNAWSAVGQEWWFDGEYLGRDVTPIESYFRALEGYFGLPRARGGGHLIERWVKSNALDEKYELAKVALGDLLENFNNAGTD